MTETNELSPAPARPKGYRKTQADNAANAEFARIYVKGDPDRGIKPNNATAAHEAVFGASASRGAQAVAAHDKLRNPKVLEGIQEYRQELALLQGKANKVFDDHLTKRKVPHQVRQRAAEYVSDQNYGKATQKIEQLSAHVSVHYDLSGGKAGDVPQEILDKLEKATTKG